MVKAKVFVLGKRFDGFPKESDFKLIEEELPAIKDEEYLAKAVYLSVDPYMRAYEPAMELKGQPFIGTQIAKIIESKNSKYPVGKYVCASFGWRSHTVANSDTGKEFLSTYLLPDFGDLPLSLGLGILGMPGNTAYFGFLELCEPKAGDTVVVTGAAGAVGSIVGQIAKIKGCKVIGIAGSDEKGKWLTEELGFDHFINYKTANLEKALPKIAPQGINCYFDNVGGETSTIILKNMNHRGRISVCGAISGYNETDLKVTMRVYEGKGLINSAINSLPIELHIPTYKFCGPGTKLEKRLRRGDAPKNGLDFACRTHDIAYSQNRDNLSARHDADRDLSAKALERFRSSDASLGEIMAALGVAGVMKAKVKLGLSYTTGLVQFSLVFKELKMEGFMVTRWRDRWMEGIEQNLKWINEGKVKYRETVTEGFENMGKAFIDMLKGKNFGKAIVKV